MARPQEPSGLICHILRSFGLQCLLGGFPEEVYILVFIRNCSLEGLFNNNNDDDLKVAHPQSGSSSTRFLIKLEFGNVSFWGEGKTGVSREKTARSKGENQQQTQPHIWRRRREMNPGHIGGRGKHSHHCAIPCSPPPCQKQYFYPPMLHALFAYLNMLICLFLFGSTSNILIMSGVITIIYVWTFYRLISVRSLFWSNLKLLKGRQTPVMFRSMETWLVNLTIFEIFIFVRQT